MTKPIERAAMNVKRERADANSFEQRLGLEVVASSMPERRPRHRADAAMVEGLEFFMHLSRDGPTFAAA